MFPDSLSKDYRVNSEMHALSSVCGFDVFIPGIYSSFFEVQHTG